MAGTLYCIGVGPGDPELLTLKALKYITSCPVLAVPQAKNGSALTAKEILLESLAKTGDIRLEDKTVLTLHFPMTRDEAVLAKAHADGAAAIEAELEQGHDVALITLGCPTVYATSIYVHRLVQRHGFPTAIIPGVPSFCAVAAKLQRPLCEKDEPLTIIPGSRKDRKELLQLPGKKVIMKPSGSLQGIQADLESLGLAPNAAMIERCGLPSEAVYEHVADAADTGYFAVIVVGTKEEES